MLGWELAKSFARRATSFVRPRADRRMTAASPVAMRARYDAAQTPAGDAKHWMNADSLSADAAHSPAVRKTLRERSRYEEGNNGLSKRMNRTKAYDLVGTGPRMQMLGPNEDENDWLEAAWIEWMRKSRFARALRTAVKAKVRDGEALGIIARNMKLSTPAKIQLRMLECDRHTTPDLLQEEPSRIDGIDFDGEGNPKTYWILDQHPGGVGWRTPNATPYPAESVVHWYEEDRPEQHRGVPEQTSSLRKFATHRRFEDATLDAAETAARFVGVVESTNQAPPDDTANDQAMDVIELERNAVTFLPDGCKLGQIDAKHPNTTFREFSQHLVAEEAAPLLMPYNVATGDSREYNYASGRLDYQGYDFVNSVDRDDLEIIIVEPVAEEFLRQTMADRLGISPRDVDVSQYPHEWHWDSRGHVDPQKEASAQDTRLKNGSTTFPREYAKAGLDWRKEFKAQARALGMSFEGYQAFVREQLTGSAASQPTDDEEDTTPGKSDTPAGKRPSRDES